MGNNHQKTVFFTIDVYQLQNYTNILNYVQVF